MRASAFDPDVELDGELIERIQTILLRWGRQNYQEFPWRSARDPYAGLVAEVLLQRTRADAVPAVYEEFMRRFPNPAHLARASEEEIARVMYPLGLRWRVPLLSALGKRLVELGRIPRDYEQLRALPGVGPYTAAAWLSFHGRGRGVLIDSNVVRWICRLLAREDCNAETRRRRWLREFTERVTPHRAVKAFNYALLDFTMNVCVPGRPRCEVCPLAAQLCRTGQIRLQGLA